MFKSVYFPKKDCNFGLEFYHNSKAIRIKAIKIILQWLTSIAIVLYLALLALCNIPIMQQWGARNISQLLADKLQTQVHIERVRIGIFNRIIIDGIRLYDQQDSLMLNVSRVAAKFEPLALLERKIRIDNAQLFGTHATLYKNTADETANYQFVLDAFKSNDTTSHPIDLKIGRLLVRHANVKFDQRDKPFTPSQFNPHHLNVKGLGFNAGIRHLTPDSINAELRRLSFSEDCGFELTRLNFELIAGSTQAKLKDLDIALPHTELNIPSLTAQYPSLPEKGTLEEWLQTVTCEGELTSSILPKDMAMFLPKLKHWNSPISLSTRIHGADGILQLEDLSLHDRNQHFRLELDGKLRKTNKQKEAEAEIKSLFCGPQFQQYITQNLEGEAREINPILTRLHQLEAKGRLHYAGEKLTAQMNLTTNLGTLHLKGNLQEGNKVEAAFHTDHFQLGKLLGTKAEQSLGHISFALDAKGKIKAEDKRPELTINGTVKELLFKEHPYRNVTFTGHCIGKDYGLHLNLDDSYAELTLQTLLHIDNPYKHLVANLAANRVNPHALNLTKKLEDEEFDMKVDIDMNGTNWDNLQGELLIHEMQMHSDSTGTLQPGDLSVKVHPEEGEKSINIDSDFLKGYIKGKFKWKNLGIVFQNIASDYLPKIFTSTENRYSDHIAFRMEVQDTALVHRLSGTALRIPEKATVEGKMNGEHGLLQVSAKMPHLQLDGEQLEQIDLQVQSSPEMLQSSLNLKRLMKNQPVTLGLNAYMGYDKVRASFNWDNELETKQQKGRINATGIFFNGRDGKLALHTKLESSDITVSDTTWTIHPAMIEYHDGVVDIKDFGLSQADRYLNVNGRLSKEATDSLAVELNKINLEYIFQLINFNAVEFAGNATGYVYAKQVLEKPVADAYLNVSDFTFNRGRMGSMDVHGNWGSHGKSIYLNAHIKDPEARHQTHVEGTITPGRGPNGGLDLRVDAKRINLFFLNKFTDGIFDNLQGRATGKARIFGPFKKINLEGDLVADEVNMGVRMLGTRYRIYGDSIILRPNNIWIRRATAYDDMGQPGGTEHLAIVNGHLMHDHLKNLRYNFDIEARNVLGYNFRDFGDQSFHGTVYASGNVKLAGEPGRLEVNINATPLSGTEFAYNVSTPETLTEAAFISYVSKKDSTATKPTPDGNPAQDEEEEEESDIYLNFDLDITPDADVRLLMDPKSGDNITLNGRGRIRANYHNKGKFRMYGIYNVERGVYKLSLQDFIRKDFVFQENSSITFGGDAYQAALNLRAIYTVPNVSLDDLSATSLGLSNTRVDCVMNITGTPGAPAVSFDFDLPNANEDEKQMVRSMVSTEEEKNMQAVYLLGIGRFYNTNAQYMQGSSQSTMAMNSLLSSTLSSQFNQMMSNMVGSNNWSFGANLRTGEMGWEELDVEGILSGRFLNNRLLFNGNFGYRESIYSNNNFIGDFDVQYLLTPTGTISLKAYNETNDRYFIQSSLTTQGIGIQFKKDFNRWKDLFKRRNRKKAKQP